MKVYEDGQRVLAALSFAEAKCNIDAATKEFRKHCRALKLKVPADARGFVLRWGQEWAKDSSVSGKASNSGRPRKLSAEQVQQVLDVILQWRADGKNSPYESIAQLKKESAVVAGIVSSTNVSDDTLITRLKELCPALSYTKLCIKPKLKKRQREDRMTTAQSHLQVPDSELECVIWIDAKTMYMVVNSKYGWAMAGDEDTYETAFPPTLKNPMKLKYYIAVNYRLGALLLVFYTGTTGMPADRDPNRVYLVSASWVELCNLVGFPVQHCLLDQGSPALQPATLITRQQPDHAVTQRHCCLGQSPVSVVSAGQTVIIAVSLSVELACVLLPLNLDQNPKGF